MNNPYWHPDTKPHTVDFDEIRQLVFDTFNIVRASTSMIGQGLDLDEDELGDPSLGEKLHFELAEMQLSKNLLRLAVLMRTLDDVLSSTPNEAYSRKARELGAENNIGLLNDTELGLREALNKIIHAEDVRPVYDSDDDPESANRRWGMDGQLELEGTFRGTKWHATINLFEFLDSVLELIEFVNEQRE